MVFSDDSIFHKSLLPGITVIPIWSHNLLWYWKYFWDVHLRGEWATKADESIAADLWINIQSQCTNCSIDQVATNICSSDSGFSKVKWRWQVDDWTGTIQYTTDIPPTVPQINEWNYWHFVGKNTVSLCHNNITDNAYQCTLLHHMEVPTLSM